MKWRVPNITCVVLSLLLGLVFLTGTRGGRAYLSPYTLEYQVQSEFAILGGDFPVYRSRPRDADNELVTFLRREGFVTAEQPAAQRWELIFHWNHAWRDGFGPLYSVFIRDRREIIEWSKADPERARIYWSEGFKYLRSEEVEDVRVGREILVSCWHSRSTEELRERIAAVKSEVTELGAVRMENQVRVIGIHPVPADEPVHLVELAVEGDADDFDFGEITQEVPGQPRSNWQAVYDERDVGKNRFAFFFHYLDTTRPLLSPAGPLDLPPESPIPAHLQGIEYEQP